MKPDKNVLAFTDRSDWRSWLDTNYSVASEAWIVIQKKHSPAPGLFLDEAVEEALCYGWIDSTLNPRDDQSFLLRFSPRKPNSVWSMSNIHRAEMLQEEGRMMEAGLAAVQAAKESGEWQAAIDRENLDHVPPDLEAALNQDPEVGDAYRKLPVSKKKQYVYWLQSAKQTETRQKRIAEILRLVRDEE
jgi:uncharacterized protein YdeI (YjbR/CyaY-like superfamily)